MFLRVKGVGVVVWRGQERRGWGKNSSVNGLNAPLKLASLQRLADPTVNRVSRVESGKGELW